MLQWRDITYSVTKKKKDGTLDTRVILNALSGDTSGGSLLALMGPSGSGKTSLLNALAFRVPKGPGAMITGAIYADGKLVETPSQMARMSAYVEQEDALFALSTVRETLMFAAQLRLSKDMPLEEKEQEVNNVIADLGLVAAADTIVGNEQIRGISGGERKRVAIGMDLLHDPRLIFMDEPTSGLDAFQALNVMTALKDLAIEKGRTIIASVHQPRSSIYALIDQLVLLSGGRLVYAGAGQGACSAHFAALGEPVPKDFNPADHFLDIISVDYRTPKLTKSTMERIEKLAKGVAREEVPIIKLVDNVPAGEGRRQGLGDGFYVERAGRGGAKLERREQVLDSVQASAGEDVEGADEGHGDAHHQVRHADVLFAAFRRGVPADGARPDQHPGPHRDPLLPGDEPGVRIRHRHLEDHPAAAQGCQQERAARMYTPLPYYVSTFLVTLPLELIPGVVYGTVIYYMTGLREGLSHYLIFLAVMTLENFAGIGLGMCLSASFTSVEMAPQLAPAFVILFLMFSGFFLNESNVPVWLIWLREISFIRYAFQALCVNEFKGAEFSCDGSMGSCVDGDEHLERLKFDDITISGNCGILAGMILGFNLLALGIVYYRQPKYLAREEDTVTGQDTVRGQCVR